MLACMLCYSLSSGQPELYEPRSPQGVKKNRNSPSSKARSVKSFPWLFCGRLAWPSCFLARRSCVVSGSSRIWGTAARIQDGGPGWAWPVMASQSVRAMAAAMDPSWVDEDEEEEEEIEEAVSVGRRPSALAVIAVPSPVGEKSPGCGRREGGPETAPSQTLGHEKRGALTPVLVYPF